MTDLPDDLKARIDEYLDGTLDADGLRRLDEQLRASEVARDYFVRYAGLHHNLFLDARGQRLLAQLRNDGGLMTFAGGQELVTSFAPEHAIALPADADGVGSSGNGRHSRPDADGVGNSGKGRPSRPAEA